MNEKAEELQNLTLNQNKAIDLLLQGFTNEEVAKRLKVNNNTIYRWRKLELFNSEFNEKQNELLDTSFRKLKSLSVKSIQALEDILDNANNENNKLKASMFIFDKLIQLDENDIVEQLELLESIVIGRLDNK